MEKSNNNEQNIIIGRNMKKHREMRNKTQADLANLLGVTAYVIGLIENGRLGLSSQELCKVAKFFDITTEEMLEEKKTSPYPVELDRIFRRLF